MRNFEERRIEDERRQQETNAKVLNLAANLDPHDQSANAQQIRETAAMIREHDQSPDRR